MLLDIDQKGKRENTKSHGEKKRASDGGNHIS